MSATLPALDLSALLRDIPAGAWVAIDERVQTVIAYGAELRSVLEEAQRKGHNHPLIARVPETTATLIL